MAVCLFLQDCFEDRHDRTAADDRGQLMGTIKRNDNGFVPVRLLRSVCIGGLVLLSRVRCDYVLNRIDGRKAWHVLERDQDAGHML